MKVIYKYPVPKTLNKFTIPLPKECDFLRIGFQNDQVFMWCLVNKDAPITPRKFSAYGTGQDVPDNQIYLATYEYGPIIIHLFEDRG